MKGSLSTNGLGKSPQSPQALKLVPFQWLWPYFTVSSIQHCLTWDHFSITKPFPLIKSCLCKAGRQESIPILDLKLLGKTVDPSHPSDFWIIYSTSSVVGNHNTNNTMLLAQKDPCNHLISIFPSFHASKTYHSCVLPIGVDHPSKLLRAPWTCMCEVERCLLSLHRRVSGTYLSAGWFLKIMKSHDAHRTTIKIYKKQGPPTSQNVGVDSLPCTWLGEHLRACKSAYSL